MTPEQFTQVERMFAELVDCDPAARQERLGIIRLENQTVHDEVVKLLKAHDGAGAFLNDPATGRLEDAIQEGAADRGIGRRFGAYEAVERIGAGGMGAVYLARRTDEQFEKHVAIKVIHWWMDTDEIMSRFERERRVLARLEHPNIAMLLDAGIDESGAPYIVMEYVAGEPIDRFAQSHTLSVEERLALFLEACDAVQTAHHNLIVHLDLKPSNILVTSDGHAKLVDFGIARLIDPDDQIAATKTDARVFTPAYAAPEQIKGGALTTTTDVYALGVVLYELLADTRPFRTDGDGEQRIEDAILNTPPVRPSTVVATTATGGAQRARRRIARRIEGDLDNIALKAMRKEPERRYPTVQSLAEDVRRHLAGRTVSARPDTFSYRTSRFVRRNRTGVIAAALVFLALVGGVIGTGWQAHETAQERDRAERRFADLRNLTNSLITEVDRDLADVPGATEARRAMVTQATQYLDSLAAEAEDEPDLLAELADSYSQLGALQRNFISTDLGDTAAAIASHQKALLLRQRVLTARPHNASALLATGQSHLQLGDMMRAQGDLEGAVEQYRFAGDHFMQAQPTDDASRIDKDHNAAVVQLKIGIVEAMLGRFDLAEAAYSTALELNQSILAADPTLLVTRRNMAVSYEKLGDIAEARGNAQLAFEHYTHSREIFHELEELEPGEARHILSIVIAHSKLGEVLGHPAYANLGDLDGALEEYYEGRRIIGELLRIDPANARARMFAAFFDRRLGAFLTMKGQYDEALEYQHAALTAAEAIAASNPSDVRALTDVASSTTTIADTHAAMGDYATSLDWTRRAIDALLEALEVNDEIVSTRIELAAAYRSAGERCADLAEQTDNNEERSRWMRDARQSIRASVEAYATLHEAGLLRAAALTDFKEAESRLAELDQSMATTATRTTPP